MVSPTRSSLAELPQALLLPGDKSWLQEVGEQREGGEKRRERRGKREEVENSHQRRLSGIDCCRSSCGCSLSECVYKMWKSPSQSLFSPATNGTVRKDKGWPTGWGGLHRQSAFFGASRHQGRGKQSFFSEIKLACSHSKHPISLTGRKD